MAMPIGRNWSLPLNYRPERHDRPTRHNRPTGPNQNRLKSSERVAAQRGTGYTMIVDGLPWTAYFLWRCIARELPVMAEFVLRVGSRSAQGVRAKNEDRFVVDLGQNLFLVADGMGGQERGELASGMAAEIIPQVVHDHLAAQEPADQAVRKA